MPRTTVSQLLRVRQGKATIQFELLDNGGLVIEQESSLSSISPHDVIAVRLNKAAVDALRALLTVSQQVMEAVSNRPTPRPSDSAVGPEGLQGTPTPEGLTRHDDGVVAGMEQ